jgi:DNA-binding GntR family transcriptional regulator
MAKYREIAADIRDRRLGTEFSLDDRLPGIAELQAQYGDVALNTVRAALNLLVEEKLLRVDPGIGTFVIALPATDPASDALAGVRTAHRVLGDVIDAAATEISAAGRDSLLSAADDLEALSPRLDAAKVPGWLRDRAAGRG